MSRLGECRFIILLVMSCKSVGRVFLHYLVCNYIFCIIARNCVLQRNLGFLAFMLGDQDLLDQSLRTTDTNVGLYSAS